jgi:Lon protease-like protein
MTRASDAATLALALFPLHTVLFPGGRLPLRIFEARYVDMIGDCMRNAHPFAVVAISAGGEVGAVPTFHRTGTLATIENWDHGPDGLLHIVARGGDRIRVLEHDVAANGLVSARVEQLATHTHAPAPEHAGLGEFLQQLYTSRTEIAPPAPWYFDDAGWIAYRLAELLPLDIPTRIRLLELDDANLKLAAIAALLESSRRAPTSEHRH